MVPGSPPAEGFASQIPNPTPAKVSLSHDRLSVLVPWQLEKSLSLSAPGFKGVLSFCPSRISSPVRICNCPTHIGKAICHCHYHCYLMGLNKVVPP